MRRRLADVLPVRPVFAQHTLSGDQTRCNFVDSHDLEPLAFNETDYSRHYGIIAPDCPAQDGRQVPEPAPVDADRPPFRAHDLADGITRQSSGAV